MVAAEEDEGHQAVIVMVGDIGEDSAEEITMVGSSTGGASEHPMQNVQKNPEKDPADTKNEGTLQEQKQDQHEDEQQ